MFKKNYIINVLEYIRGAINIGESSDNLIKYINQIEKNLNDEEKEYWRKKEENMFEEQAKEKHLKGFIFDSLVYRYQLARLTQADLEAQNSGTSIEKERNFAKRDMMRFIEILDEAIGGHD